MTPRRALRARSPLNDVPELDEATTSPLAARRASSSGKVNGVDGSRDIGEADLAGMEEYDSEIAWLDDLLSPTASTSSQAPSLASLDSRLSRLLSELELATTDTSMLVSSTIEDVARTVPRLTLDLQLMRENAILLGYGLEGVRKRTIAVNTATNVGAFAAPDKKLKGAVNGIAAPDTPIITPATPRSALDSEASEETVPSSPQPTGPVDTDHVLEHLRVLDLTKSRMDAARAVLREAESWSTLDSDIRMLLASAASVSTGKDKTAAQSGILAADPKEAVAAFRQAALRLSEASRSLSVFASSPEYTPRSSLLRSLTNELEASICSPLLVAVEKRDDAGIRALKDVFKMVDREREFESWYWMGRRKGVMKLWSDVELIDAPPTASPDLSRSQEALGAEPIFFAAFLDGAFYPMLVRLLHDEVPHLPVIFPPPASLPLASPTTGGGISPQSHTIALPSTVASTYTVNVLTSFLASTLESLSPSLSTRLTASSSSSAAAGSSPLAELIKSWKATESFGVEVEKTIAKLDAVIGPSPSSLTPAGHHGAHGHHGEQVASPLPSPATTATTESTPFDSTSSTPGATIKRDRRSSRHLSISSKRPRGKSVSGSLGEESASVPSAQAAHPGAPSVGSLEPPGQVRSRQQRHVQAEPIREWELAAFEPFLEFQMSYPSLEQTHLSHQLTSHLRSSLPTLRVLPTGRQLTDALVPLLAWADEAWERCTDLTHGYGAPGCIRAVDAMLEGFLIRAKNGIEEAQRDRRDGRRGSSSAKGTGQSGNGLGEDDDGVDLEGLDYSSEDWELFQSGLRILESCRTISDRISTLDARFRTKLTVLSGLLKDTTVFRPPNGTTKGAMTLLRQSALNSRELAVLLDAVTGGHSEARKVSGSSVVEDDNAARPSISPHATRHSHSFSISGLPTAPQRLRDPDPALIFGAARASVTALTRACQLLVHSTILAPLMAQLALYPSLPAWTATAAEIKAQTSSAAAFDMQMPKFSLSPTETISRVGEGLFNLPRLFEVYAADDALTFSIETLPFVDADSLLRSLGVEPMPSPPLALKSTKRGGFLDVGGGYVDAASGGTAVGATRSVSPNRSVRPPAELPNLSAETVISTWLSSLTLSVISHLTSNVLPSIPRLSAHGAAQVSSDLAYISNVASALDAEGDDLERWREACELEKLPSDADAVTADDILAKVARMRGWR